MDQFQSTLIEKRKEMLTGQPKRLLSSNLREKLHSMASHFSFGRIMMPKRNREMNEEEDTEYKREIHLTCIFT